MRHAAHRAHSVRKALAKPARYRARRRLPRVCSARQPRGSIRPSDLPSAEQLPHRTPLSRLPPREPGAGSYLRLRTSPSSVRPVARAPVAASSVVERGLSRVEELALGWPCGAPFTEPLKLGADVLVSPNPWPGHSRARWRFEPEEACPIDRSPAVEHRGREADRARKFELARCGPGRAAVEKLAQCGFDPRVRPGALGAELQVLQRQAELGRPAFRSPSRRTASRSALRSAASNSSRLGHCFQPPKNSSRSRRTRSSVHRAAYPGLRSG